MKIKILSANYHRNGVSGVGFYAVIFEAKEKGEPKDTFYAPVYPRDACADELLAVVRVSDIAAGNTDTAWRGDVFADDLRPALDAYVFAAKGYKPFA